jgi:hypothetical protein
METVRLFPGLSNASIASGVGIAVVTTGSSVVTKESEVKRSIKSTPNAK